LSRAGELFEYEVHHLPQRGVLVLKELRDTKEEVGGFVGRKALPREEEQSDFGQEYATFPR